MKNLGDTVGTTVDMASRIKSVLPTNWFADSSPNLNAVLTGLGSIWSGLYGLLQSVGLQARVATASGVFLDIVAQDYFGNNLSRRAGEADAIFKQRISANLLAPRATRQALAAALVRLTGRNAEIFEPTNPRDTGGYNTNTLGYNSTGGYGSIMLPYQVFVTAYRPNSTPISNAGGYNSGPGGYNVAPMFYVQNSENRGALNDTEIYMVISETLPTNTVAWTRLSN